MDDITGLLLIGMGAMTTVLIIAAMRDKADKEVTQAKNNFYDTVHQLNRSTPQEATVTPLTTSLIAGPNLPTGLTDIMDPSQLDYILNATDRMEMKTYWSRFLKYNSYIYEAARITQVPNNVIRAVMIIESSVVNSSANSAAGSTGSIGLMQLTIGAARDMGYTGDRTGLYTDPRQNIILGSKFLAYQYKRYGFDWNQAFAAYNFGSVHRWSKGVTPMTGVTGDRQWAAVVDLVSEGKITRFRGVHNPAGYGPIVNQGYVDKVNKWWRILNQVIIVK